MICWGGRFDFSLLNEELKNLKKETENPEIWENSDAKSLFQKIKIIEKKIKDFETIKNNLEYIEDLFRIAIEESNDEYFTHLSEEADKLLVISNRSRLENLMSEAVDVNNVPVARRLIERGADIEASTGFQDDTWSL